MLLGAAFRVPCAVCGFTYGVAGLVYVNSWEDLHTVERSRCM